MVPQSPLEIVASILRSGINGNFPAQGPTAIANAAVSLLFLEVELMETSLEDLGLFPSSRFYS